jgi:hypothetical protein
MGLAAGLVVALIVAGIWPSTPLHAMATDRSGDFAIATGPVDEATEAVYFMDFLTGDLLAVVVGKNPQSGAPLVTGLHRINVVQAMQLNAGTNPKFLMTTGMVDFRRGGGAGGTQPSKAVLYVAEVSSGTCGVFLIPFNMTLHKAGRPNSAPLMLATSFRFRIPAAGARGKAVEE